ncbi:MAG: hypothetical protein JW827_07595, partial [Spirochaetes bacterium]|nr:hypothetical protein [Spirochaetota bacterium]
MKNNLFKTDNKLSLSIYFLFFLSGFNSLVIQIISIYSLGIVLGNTAYSMSVVVTAFMLGLALGSCLAERMIHKNVEFFKRWNILIYGVVTLLVGLYSCKIIPLIILKNDFFLSLTTASKKVLPLIINHFFVSFGLLAVPTIGMGLTFPVLALSMKTRKDNSVLYAVNTGGAAAGSIVTGFFLIKYLGVLQSLYLVFLSGLFVFFCALLIIIFYRRSSLLASAPVKEPSVLIKGQHSLTVGELYLFSFLSGFIFLSYEMLFNRIFSLVLGNRI